MNHKTDAKKDHAENLEYYAHTHSWIDHETMYLDTTQFCIFSNKNHDQEQVNESFQPLFNFEYEQTHKIIYISTC